MGKTIELVFDFVSPNAYLIWQPLKALAQKHSAKIEVIPAFLGGMHKMTGNERQKCLCDAGNDALHCQAWPDKMADEPAISI